MPQPLRHHRLWSFIGWLGLALVVALSLLPLPAPPIDIEQGDKLGHVLAYFALTAWHAQLGSTRSALAWRALAFALTGLALEVLQSWTGWRHGNDPMDALANLAGTAAGLALGLTPARGLLAALEQRLPSPRLPR
jgi:VanZ family protein